MTTSSLFSATGRAARTEPRPLRLIATGVALGALMALPACQTVSPGSDAGLESTAATTPASAQTREVQVASAEQLVQTDAAPAAGPRADSLAAAPDPLEIFNRTIYGFNWYVDHVFLRPVALAYRAGVPDPARQGVRNVLRNLKAPIVLFNDSLQGNWDRAETTAMRFVINTTVGLLGLIDVAEDMGYPYHSEDFGQTMAVHGVGTGPYLMLPLIGPSNLRDGVGFAVDWALDPFRIYAATENPEWHPEATYVRTGLTVVDTREALLDPLEEIEASSIDTYAALRAMYAQRRAAAIRNAADGGEQETGGAVDGSAFDFED